MGTMYSVGDVAKQLGVLPRHISRLFYDQEVRADLCPIIAGSRIIPAEFVPVIAMTLRRKGHTVKPCPPANQAAGARL